MLKVLHIENYALIEQMEIVFSPGLNILTGETGAGKSIILGAIGLVLGERANSDIIRQDASSAIVEAVLAVPKSLYSDLFDDEEILGSDSEGLLIRREVHRAGKSRCFVNDVPVPLSKLIQLGDRLVDLHGQHEHQALLKVDKHLEYLDNFGVDIHLRTQVAELYKKWRVLETQFREIEQKEKLLNAQKDLFEFQLHEIEKIDPKPDEDVLLEQEERILQNAEKLFETTKQLTELLYEGEGSVSEKLASVHGLLSELSGVDPIFREWVKITEDTRVALEDMLRAIASYTNKIEYNPQRLEEIRDRLAQLSRLKKKYGGTLAQVFQYKAEVKRNLDQTESFSEQIDFLSKEIKETLHALTQVSKALSQERQTVAKNLEAAIEQVMKELGLSNGIFQVMVKQKEDPEGPIEIDGVRYAVSPLGIDTAEFFVSLNPGEPPKPLVQVASGGEISRLMLAMKSVLAKADAVPVLIFDEIDTGISGRIAYVVGQYLKKLAKSHQVICITHLPQIASMGDVHFRVSKEVKENRTYTSICSIEGDERVIEIAKLIGGERITESTLNSAKELLMASHG